MKNSSYQQIPLFIPHSSVSTQVNKTGSWRFFLPKFDEKTAPCSAACPLGQDIARIEMLASWGMLKDAWHLILRENPFPGICGRVCFHPCEKTCNRANLDTPVAIHHLERFLADTAISNKTRAVLHVKPDNGKKVAIAGAGPSGLSAAYFLSLLGFRCDVFEARSEPGGLLRWGIPSYRLPRNILSAEINRVRDLGVVVHCDKLVNERLMTNIRRDYDAVFIGCGYEQSVTLKIQGGDLMQDGLSFLRNFDPQKTSSFNGIAAIVGGGNTAIDIARSLVRQGVKPLILYRRRLEDMPAFEPEIAMAIKEGVQIMELVAPIRIQQNSGSKSLAGSNFSLTLQKMKTSQKKIGGRAVTIPDGEKFVNINVQRIFTAIGARAESLWNFRSAKGSNTFELSHCRLIEQETPVIFGGDLTTPAKSVADAIASGKQAAMLIDTYFEKGLNAVKNRLSTCRVGAGPALSLAAYLDENHQQRNAHIVGYDEIVSDYFRPAPRNIPAVLDIHTSIRTFKEVGVTYGNDTAKKEAARCFNCGICNACDYCRLYCPEMAIQVENTKRKINLDYCKGCGVCAKECPRNAMALEEEIK